MRLLEAGTGKLVRSIMEHEGHVSAVAFSPDGRRAASAALQDGSVRLWDVATGKQLRQSEGGLAPLAVQFFPDGRRVLSAGEDGRVRLWHLDAPDSVPPRLLPEPPALLARVSAVTVSPDGQRFATAEQSGRVILWDGDGQTLREWQLPGPVHSIAFAPDGRHLATANGNGTVYLFRLAPPPR